MTYRWGSPGYALVLELGRLQRINLPLLDLENARLALCLAHLRSRRISNKRRLVVLATLHILRPLCRSLPRDQGHEGLLRLQLGGLHHLLAGFGQIQLSGVGPLSQGNQVLETGLHYSRLAVAASRNVVVLCLSLAIDSPHERIRRRSCALFAHVERILRDVHLRERASITKVLGRARSPVASATVGGWAILPSCDLRLVLIGAQHARAVGEFLFFARVFRPRQRLGESGDGHGG